MSHGPEIENEEAREVKEEQNFPNETQGKMGMWVFLSGELVIFGTLILAFVVFRTSYPEIWGGQQSHLKNTIGTINTFILLTSSWTIVMSYKNFDLGDRNWGQFWLLLTVLFGLTFMGIKAYEWTSEITSGYYPGSPELTGLETQFWGFYYGMTGLHGLHVFIGIIINFMILSGDWLNWIDDTSYRVEYAGLYWHLVDIIWVFLFPMFYLMYNPALIS